jgi:hypothetical protein
MVSRVLHCVAALIVAGLAFAAVPASAHSRLVCSYDEYGRPYNCHHTGFVVPTYQPSCNNCGTRGLFTSTWVQPAPCGSCPQMHAPLQPCGSCGRPVYVPAYVTEPVDEDDKADDDAPRYRESGPRCGYVHGHWRCGGVDRAPARRHAPKVRRGY